jgi:hypothetical protein
VPSHFCLSDDCRKKTYRQNTSNENDYLGLSVGEAVGVAVSPPPLLLLQPVRAAEDARVKPKIASNIRFIVLCSSCRDFFKLI